MIGGENLWDIETAFYINERGIVPEKAHTFVIIRWMLDGDFGPLAAAIREGHVPEVVLGLLGSLIAEDRLRLIPKGRGRPKAPTTFARRIVAAQAYDSTTGRSDERFEDIAKKLDMSEPSVRQHVTAWRKAEKRRTHN